ncbi:hypothetical protein [Rhodanobacter lindaniclasticus]
MRCRRRCWTWHGSSAGTGLERARSVLDSGRALAKFLAICEAQGGFREPARAPFTADVPASASGRITEIDNRRLAKLAKLAGAPTSPTAGLETSLRVGDAVERGLPLTLHAESPGELAYALENRRHLATLRPWRGSMTRVPCLSRPMQHWPAP